MCTQCSLCGNRVEMVEQQTDSTEEDSNSEDLSAVQEAPERFGTFGTSDDGGHCVDDNSPSWKRRRVDDLSSSSNDKVVCQIQGDTMSYESAKSWADRRDELINERWLKLLDAVGNCGPEITVKHLASFLRRNSPSMNSLLKASSTEESIRLLHEHRAFAEELRKHPSFEVLAETLPVPSIDACVFS